MLLARGPGLPPQWFGPCPQPPLIAGLNYKERQRLHNTARAHRLRCKWAVDRLRAELMRTVARRRFVLARSSSPIPARASSSASESPEAEGGAPPSPLPAEDEEEGSPEPPSAGGRKRTRSRWQVHFPWRFVSPQALNASGDQIVYRVDDDRDRKWAWRLERAVDHHSAVRERDLDKLSDMHATEVKEITDGSLLRWRQERIDALEAKIVAMHKTFYNGRGYGL